MVDQSSNYGNFSANNGPTPARPHPSFSSQATGKQLLKASWGLLRQDRDLLWLPVRRSWRLNMRGRNPTPSPCR